MDPVPPVPSVGVVYATANELFGKPVDLAVVRRLFSEIPRGAMTSVLCRLGVLFNSDDHEKWIDLDRRELRSVFLDPPTRALVDAFDEATTARAGVAFCRPQALLALRLAQHLCSGEEKDVIPKGDLLRIGLALLHVSDLLGDPRDAKENRPSDVREAKKYLAAMMVSLFDASNPPTSPHAIKRTFEMVCSPRWETDATLRDAREAFQARVGLSIKQYMAVVAALTAKFTRQEDPERSIEVLMGPIFSTARDREGLRKAIDLISVPYADLPGKTLPPERIVTDRSDEPFRSAPLIGFPDDRFLCADATFLKLRITNGLFWTIKPFLAKEKQVDLFRAWGELFEDYVHDTLEPVIKKRYKRSPKDTDGAELTDALVDYDDVVVLMEFKAVLIPDTQKFGRDPDALIAVLEEKLLKVDQIVRALVRLFGPDSKGEARRHLRKDFIQRVYPVIVSYDHSACSPFLEDLLNERLQEHLRDAGLPKHPIIQSLTIIAADDVDLLVPLLKHGVKLSKMLQERIAMRRSDVTFNDLLYTFAERLKMPFRFGPEYTKVFDEGLEFWKLQDLPADVRW